jgi:hypothetical protein
MSLTTINVLLIWQLLKQFMLDFISVNYNKQKFKIIRMSRNPEPK